MGIQSKLQPYLSTAIGGSEVTPYEHVQGYQTFANQGQRVDLSVIREVDDASGHVVFKHENASSTTVLTQQEAFLMNDVLKDYQNQWGFGWNRQMASKTGTSDNGKGGIPDSWIMAYNPNIVIGVWVGNTAPNGGGGLIKALGEQVGRTLMKRFVNNLPANMREWYSRPSGVSTGCGSDSKDPFLQGTCTSPTPSTPSPTATPSPALLPSPLPSLLPSPTPIVSPPPPQPSPTAKPAPTAPPSP
jgi:penicillin-binding protein 1A